MRKHKRTIIQWLSLVTGVFLTALPFPILLVPNDIAPGGVTGVATLIHSITGWPIGLMAAIINVPLFLLSWRRMGRGFAVRSLICTLGVSAVIDLLPFGPITSDPILAAVFGGVIMGAGLGLVIRGGATTGGTDMAASLIHARIPSFSVGGLILALDFCIVVASAFVFSIQASMYALITIFLTSKVIDMVVEGFDSSKAFFVFSAKSEEIAAAIMTDMDRGATLLHSKGAYSSREGDVLLCVVRRMEVPGFKRLVSSIDPNAFVMLTDVREVHGEGFTRQ